VGADTLSACKLLAQLTSQNDLTTTKIAQHIFISQYIMNSFDNVCWCTLHTRWSAIQCFWFKSYGQKVTFLQKAFYKKVASYKKVAFWL